MKLTNGKQTNTQACLLVMLTLGLKYDTGCLQQHDFYTECHKNQSTDKNTKRGGRGWTHVHEHMRAHTHTHTHTQIYKCHVISFCLSNKKFQKINVTVF
jgi:hypothetical protein